MEALLEVQHMTKFYGSRSSLTKAVNDISFFVEKGEFTAVMGASGSGKTTLLNCISTIDRVTSGHILVEGQDITRLRGKKSDEVSQGENRFYFSRVSSFGYAECF